MDISVKPESERSVRERKDQAAKERAVLDAACRVRAVLDAACRVVEQERNSKDLTQLWHIKELIDAVDALNQSQAVRPEDLEPGQKFRFDNKDRVYQCAADFETDQRWAFDTVNGRLYPFLREMKIHPIKDQDHD